MPGYIYLIRMADGVYKVGRTRQQTGLKLSRLDSYPRDSTIIYIRKTDDEIQVEKYIVSTFLKKFGKHPRGSEYFIGDETTMTRIIDEYIDPKNIPLDWWDGQAMHVSRMIREIHARQSAPHFKYENLLKALEARGYTVDFSGSVTKVSAPIR